MVPRRTFVATGLLISAAACYPRLDVVAPTTGVTTDDSGTSDGGAVGDLAVETVFPTDGPNNGGTPVEITGGPFDDSVKVRFGDFDAEVTSVSMDSLTVTTPSATGTGNFDVVAVQDDASGTLPDAWYYWDDAQGKAVIVGTWLHLTVAGSSSMTGSTASSMAGGIAATFDTWLRFIQPTDVQPWERYGVAMDDCGAPRDKLSSLQGPDEVQLGYDSQLLSLTWNDARQEYAYNASSSPAAIEDEPMVLKVSRSELSPPMNLPEVARTQSRIDVSSPELGSSTAELEQDDAEVNWTPDGYSHVMIVVGVDTDARFLCMAQDDGTYTIPGGWFDDLEWETSGLDRTTQVWIAVTGVSTGETSLAWTNGVARVDAGLGLVGPVTIVDDLLRVTE